MAASSARSWRRPGSRSGRGEHGTDGGGGPFCWPASFRWSLASAVSWAKFGIPYGYPLHDQVYFNRFLKHIKGSYFSARYLPTTIATYLGYARTEPQPGVPIRHPPDLSGPSGRQRTSLRDPGSHQCARIDAPALPPHHRGFDCGIATAGGFEGADHGHPSDRGSRPLRRYSDLWFSGQSVPGRFRSPSWCSEARSGRSTSGADWMGRGAVTRRIAVGSSPPSVSSESSRTWASPARRPVGGRASRPLVSSSSKSPSSSLTGHPLAGYVSRGGKLPKSAPNGHLFILGDCTGLYIYTPNGIRGWLNLEKAGSATRAVDVTIHGSTAAIGRRFDLVHRGIPSCEHGVRHAGGR